MSYVQPWMFTINNPTDADAPKTWTGVQYLIYQLEKGEAGTEHYQGYVVFHKKKRLSALKKINNKAHWEPRGGSHEQARAYCSKEATRLMGPYEDGEPPRGQGARSDLDSIRLAIIDGATDLDIADSNFPTFCHNYRAFREYRRLKLPKRSTVTQATCIYGPTGTGKTTYVKNLLKGESVYWKPRGKWWDDYAGEKNVVMDEFYGWLEWDVLLRMLEQDTPLQVETKGGSVHFVSTHVYILSNKPYTEWYRFDGFYPQALRRRLNRIGYMGVTFKGVPSSPVWEKDGPEPYDE